MSDPQYGEPVEETTPEGEATSTSDAVASANEALAEAEAAQRDIVVEETVTASEPVVVEDAAGEVYVAEAVVPAETVVVEESAPYAEEIPTEAYITEPDVAPVADVYPAYGETITPSEPVVPVVAAAPQPIFVQAPEAPQPRGNRAAAGAIGVLAALAFGVLYLGAALGLRAIDGDVTTANVGTEALAALTSWWFWVPVVTYFLGFWLLGAIINRGRWGHWVIFGLLIGVVAYGGHILGQLFQAPFWTLTAREGADLVDGQLLAPLAIAAFIFGRELTIWFGAWVSARGKRVNELNNEAQREYERTLEAGPRLHQA